MAKSPSPPRDPAKHPKKDPARPTRAKAHWPDSAPTDPALERLLNPGIEKGTAGMGSGTGLTLPASSFRGASEASEPGIHTSRNSHGSIGVDVRRRHLHARMVVSDLEDQDLKPGSRP